MSVFIAVGFKNMCPSCESPSIDGSELVPAPFGLIKYQTIETIASIDFTVQKYVSKRRQNLAPQFTVEFFD